MQEENEQGIKQHNIIHISDQQLMQEQTAGQNPDINLDVFMYG